MSEDNRYWRLIAADMIAARKFSVGKDTNPNGPEMRAASFLFDEGIFYLGPAGMDEVAKMLRDNATLPTPKSIDPHKAGE